MAKATDTSGGTFYQAFQFAPAQLPGFTDYFGVYSQFRILKAKAWIHRINTPVEASLSYLVVSSQPFCDNTVPDSPAGTGVPSGTVVPVKTESELRQARWQRLKFPSSDRIACAFSFRPYTALVTGGPLLGSASRSNLKWWRRWDAKKWMPLQWANVASSNVPLCFYGPYIVSNLPTGGDPTGSTLHLTLQVMVQFKGQK